MAERVPAPEAGHCWILSTIDVGLNTEWIKCVCTFVPRMSQNMEQGPPQFSLGAKAGVTTVQAKQGQSTSHGGGKILVPEKSLFSWL